METLKQRLKTNLEAKQVRGYYILTRTKDVFKKNDRKFIP